jgi:hypothetical protein
VNLGEWLPRKRSLNEPKMHRLFIDVMILTSSGIL